MHFKLFLVSFQVSQVQPQYLAVIFTVHSPPSIDEIFSTRIAHLYFFIIINLEMDVGNDTCTSMLGICSEMCYCIYKTMFNAHKITETYARAHVQFYERKFKLFDIILSDNQNEYGRSLRIYVFQLNSIVCCRIFVIYLNEI